MKLICVCILFFTSLICEARDYNPLNILRRDDRLIPLSTNDFIFFQSPNVFGLKIKYVNKEIKWERVNNLLIPYAQIIISYHGADPANISFHYKQKTFLPEIFPTKSSIELTVPLFDPAPIEVYFENNLLTSILHKNERKITTTNTILVDYSCAPYELNIEEFQGEFLSVGCELKRVGDVTEQRGQLLVTWISSDYRLLNQKEGPYTTVLTSSGISKTQVVNNDGQKKDLVIRANVPKRLHRLKLASSIGPYEYEAQSGKNKLPKNTHPSFMLYGNLYLNDTTSFKFFDAVVAKESIFNHAGAYIGNEITKAFDDRLIFSTLIGLQILSFRLLPDEDLFHEFIYPQGIEAIFRHPFGLENHRLHLGAFISPVTDVEYNNFWIRYGKNIFIELNYIHWQHGSMSANMTGLSLGFPILSAF
jgi:hypothetical protein